MQSSVVHLSIDTIITLLSHYLLLLFKGSESYSSTEGLLALSELGCNMEAGQSTHGGGDGVDVDPVTMEYGQE